MSIRRQTLLARCTCPHCWEQFAPEDVLWVATHAELRGDPCLDEHEPQRFLPSCFDADGNAIDARGCACHSLACPKCHLGFPRILLEQEPFFISILGSPRCGKSVFLAAMTYSLRRVLPNNFGLSFEDADPAANARVIEYEERLFLNARPDDPVPLNKLIDKTKMPAHDPSLYDHVAFGEQKVALPRPFVFNMRPRHGHLVKPPAVVLYDNAGEDFLIGSDAPGKPVTRHLARSQLLLFLFDPLQDSRFRALCTRRGGLGSEVSGLVTYRQEVVLAEAIGRVRRYAGLGQNEKHTAPLVVVVTKSDAWGDLLGEDCQTEPWHGNGQGMTLDRNRVQATSLRVRHLVHQTCPEFVDAAEAFARDVTYVPVSALGNTPTLSGGLPTVRPRDIEPRWVTVPFTVGLLSNYPHMLRSNSSNPELGDSHRLPRQKLVPGPRKVL